MDKSKEYILMCKKALEIQFLARNEKQGFTSTDTDIFPKDTNYWYVTVKDTVFVGKGAVFAGYVWLPRQDQLQEIWAKDKMYTTIIMCEKISEFLGAWRICPEYIEALNARSMEQTWLAFIMKEKYNKIWTGKDWKER